LKMSHVKLKMLDLVFWLLLVGARRAQGSCAPGFAWRARSGPVSCAPRQARLRLAQ
ncbi:hypothetical protein A2U01_0076945, partial [Trifolium medium]|nr:hypothetical protein [Trifolium medium]